MSNQSDSNIIRIYLLKTENQVLEEVSIRDVTLSETKAKRWLNKRFKTVIPSYQVIDI